MKTYPLLIFFLLLYTFCSAQEISVFELKGLHGKLDNKTIHKRFFSYLESIDFHKRCPSGIDRFGNKRDFLCVPERVGEIDFDYGYLDVQYAGSSLPGTVGPKEKRIEGYTATFYRRVDNETIVRGRIRWDKNFKISFTELHMNGVINFDRFTWIDDRLLSMQEYEVYRNARKISCNGNCKNGKGTLINEEKGTKYVGSFRDSKKSGFGKLYKSDILVYEGYWEDDQYNGFGTDYQLYSGSSANYTGHFINGKLNGKVINESKNFDGNYWAWDQHRFLEYFKDGTRVTILDDKYMGSDDEVWTTSITCKNRNYYADFVYMVLNYEGHWRIEFIRGLKDNTSREYYYRYDVKPQRGNYYNIEYSGFNPGYDELRQCIRRTSDVSNYKYYPARGEITHNGKVIGSGLSDFYTAVRSTFEYELEKKVYQIEHNSSNDNSANWTALIGGITTIVGLVSAANYVDKKIGESYDRKQEEKRQHRLKEQRQGNTYTSKKYDSTLGVYRYDLGDAISCFQWEKTSGYKGIVMDRKNDRYLIEITRVITNGWFGLHLNPSSCSGNVRLHSVRDRLDQKGVGSLIWVPKDCLD